MIQVWQVHRAAHRPAKIVRHLLRLVRRAIRRRIERRVLEIPEGRPMQRVRARLRHRRNLARLRVLRIVVHAVDAYLRNRFRRRKRVAQNVVRGLVLRRNPVDRRLRLRRQPTLNGKLDPRVRARRGLRRIRARVRLNARQRLDHVQRRGRTRAAIVRRQVEHCLRRKRRRNPSVIRVDRARVGRVHRHRLARLSPPKAQDRRSGPAWAQSQCLCLFLAKTHSPSRAGCKSLAPGSRRCTHHAPPWLRSGPCSIPPDAA